jgi:MoaA/NifB/PqqE/SkfB family radical SAM enzyme
MNKKIELLKRDFLKDKKLVILSLTKRCNLLCKYCRTSKNWYDTLSQHVNDIDLSKDKWEEIKQFYYENNIAEILLT